MNIRPLTLHALETPVTATSHSTTRGLIMVITWGVVCVGLASAWRWGVAGGSSMLEGLVGLGLLVGIGLAMAWAFRAQRHIAALTNQQYQIQQELAALNQHWEQELEKKMGNLSEVNAQLAQQNASLQTLDQLKSEFVSLVSHELRSPLTTINGGIELLLITPDVPTQVYETLALIQTQIKRLTTFIETILNVSALETGRLPLYPEPLALSPVLTALRAQLSVGVEAERLVFALPRDLPSVVADERALTSVLFHLIDNALKYAPESEVRVEAQVEGHRVWIHVTDHGPGIPPKDRQLIFERFERLDQNDSRAVYGHGLGLYMCRRLLQALGSEIKADEAPGGGARFTFWLPAVEAEHGE